MKLHLKLGNNNDIYYSANKPYSYDLFMHEITGGRGIGKTTTFLIKALQNVEKGEEFMYMRRYKPELKQFVAKNTLGTVCDSITAKGDGTGGFVFISEDTICGYGIALSTAMSYKSTDFSKVSLLIFDEATLPPGPYRYLPNEHELLLEFISTVLRTRKKLKVFILGNNVDMFNPHLRYYRVPTNIDGIYVDKKRGLYVEFAKNSPKLLEMEKETPLYKLTEGTAYHDYHYNNKVMGAPQVVPEKMPTQTSLLCRLIIDADSISIYHYRDKHGDLRLYVQHKAKVYKDDYSYNLMHDGVVNTFYLSMYNTKLRKYLERFYHENLISYSDELGANMLNWIVNQL